MDRRSAAIHIWRGLPISSNIRSSPRCCHVISQRTSSLAVTFFAREGIRRGGSIQDAISIQTV
jgi:hypothetical protein